MANLLAIGLGGFLGAIARHGITSWIQRGSSSPFPLGILVTNVVGCFLMGILLYLVQEREFFTPATRGFLMVGVLGAMTTFSAFSMETIRLAQSGRWIFALVNVMASVLLCLGALVLGRFLMRTIAS